MIEKKEGRIRRREIDAIKEDKSSVFICTINLNHRNQILWSIDFHGQTQKTKAKIGGGGNRQVILLVRENCAN